MTTDCQPLGNSGLMGLLCHSQVRTTRTEKNKLKAYPPDDGRFVKRRDLNEGLAGIFADKAGAIDSEPQVPGPPAGPKVRDGLSSKWNDAGLWGVDRQRGKGG